jgi:hypothetical protein
VARQRLAAAPRRQARPKGSPGANKVPQGLFLKIILKKVKIKKLSVGGRHLCAKQGVRKCDCNKGILYSNGGHDFGILMDSRPISKKIFFITYKSPQHFSTEILIRDESRKLIVTRLLITDFFSFFRRKIY